MIVDRRKDSYDELMMLSRDSRLERNRKSQWTTGLVAAAVVTSGIYVGGTNEHLADLAEALAAAKADLKAADGKLESLNAELAALKTERDYAGENLKWFRDLAIALSDSDDVIKEIERIDPIPENPSALANVVWIVDGSRRFPMTDGDILWVPEGNFWVRLESPSDSDPVNKTDTRDPKRKLRKVSFHYDAMPTNQSAAGMTKYLGGADRYFEEQGKWDPGTHGTSNCIQITLHYNSRRPGFTDPKYLDMEVLLYSNPSCPREGTVTPQP